MFYIAAFVLGGFARSWRKLLLFATVYMVLYSALIVALDAQTLRAGTADVKKVFFGFAIDWAVGFAICGLGYLCRLAIHGRLPTDAARAEEVSKTFE